MKRRSSWYLPYALALVAGGPVVLSVVAPGSPFVRVAKAQDISSPAGLAKACYEHGLYEAATEFAIDAGKDALVIRALALGARSKAENDPKLLNEAKKVLGEAKAAGVRGAAEAESMLQNPPPPKYFQGRLELDFAWRLKSRGKIGAAEQAIDGAIKNAGLQGSDLRNAQLIRASLFGDRASYPMLANSDAAKRKEFMDKCKAQLLEIANAAGATPDDIVEAKGTLYDTFFKRGNTLLEFSKHPNDDLSAQEALKKEAVDAFKDAVTWLETECKELNAKLDAGEQGPPPAKEGDEPGKPTSERCLVFANYYWPKCMVGQAKILSDKAEKESVIKKALEIYNDYNLRFGQEFQGFEAAIDMAEAYGEIGDDENAIVALESALAIEKLSPEYDPLHPPDPRKGLKLDQQSLDVFARGSLVKGKTLKRKGDQAKALAAFEKVFAHAKASNIDYDKEALGTALRIEMAESLAKTGKMKEAKASLEKIIAADPSGATAVAARAMMARLSGGGGDAGELAGVTLERALKLMEEALDKGELGTAATWARNSLRLAKKEKKESEGNPPALLGLGRAYEGLGRYYEAAIAFEEVTRRYKENRQVASQAALGMVNAFQVLKGKTPSAWDKEQYEKALRFLTDNFPTEGKGVAPYLLGRQLQEESRFDDAAKEFDKVPTEAGDVYDKALYAASLSRYLSAKQLLREKKDAKAAFQAVEQSLRKTLEVLSSTNGISEDRQKKRKDLDAEVRFLLGDTLLNDAVGKPSDVLPLFEGADKLYEGNNDRISRAGFFKVLAYVRLAQLDKAETECKTLLEKYKGEKRTILACKEMALGLDKEHVKKSKELSEGDRRAARARIAFYYARWILDGNASDDTKPSLKECRDVAERIFRFALDVSGLREDGGFIGDLEDNFDPGVAKQIFADTKDIYAFIANPEALKGLKDAWVISAYYGESAGFAGDWNACREGLDAAITATNMLKKDGSIDPTGPVSKNKVLLAYYYDLGRCYTKLGASDKANFDKAFGILNNVIAIAAEKSKIWWKAKYDYYRALFDRGEEKDLKELAGALRSLERKYPQFAEAEKQGLGQKFPQLVRDVEEKTKQKVLGG